METEFLARLAVVAVAIVITIVVARTRPSRRPKPLDTVGNLEGPGVYLFTSERCDSCAAARTAYVDALGEDGFTELSWDEHAGLLSRLGVEEVPVGSVVGSDGTELASFRLVPSVRALRRAATRARG